MITEIEFKRTGHTLLNNGIIGLYKYLVKAKNEDFFDFPFEFELTNNKLTITSDKLPQLLDDIYYWMGKEVYDTYTIKQQENAEKFQECNIFYDRAENKFFPFPRMYTYGLTHLLTNNAQGVTRHEKGWTNAKKLEKSDPEELAKFVNFFETSGLKILSKLYYEPYTKITRIPKLKESFLNEGDRKCYLTGESYDELVDVTNISPFFSGLFNFNSYLSAGDKKISWKTRYLSMFSPVNAYYHYSNKLRDTIHIYLVSSDNLKNLNELISKIEIQDSTPVLRKKEFVSNIKFAEEIEKDSFTEQFEVAIALIYSMYKKAILKYGNISENQFADDELFGEVMTKIPPLAIESFKAESFASTMRPNTYENLNRLTPLFKLFHDVEKSGIVFSRFLSSLKLLKPSERAASNKYRLERILRNQISREILELKSILPSIEDLFFRSYNYLCINEPIGFKDFKQLFLFTQLYELKIKTMEESLQNAAITLGKQIGVKMRHQDASQSEAANAKRGRGDLITLRKARTQKQFLDELIRIDFKYGLTVNEELAGKINEQNYYSIKQFLIIGALNILNPAIQPIKKTEKTA
ncbi:hypothetical protein SAMN05444280_11631 [Tangfeifania diversioriginum]|uniref:CRISPR-associated protein Csh1 n=1 Tax=Tangfeifania diversioriginum TaxID=1168035 RepID=A0A1M6IBJ8_9BACT|nr:hypothetical protein [Tangfeifania diversioriginum]SHJ31803.1 hypothetical protein SAMN05444280_11631 [Tangfeifania diversioriginum]